MRCFLRVCVVGVASCLAAELIAEDFPTPEELAASVKIYRDSHGVAHIDAKDVVGVAFGEAYAQCEDYFWQVEDSLVWSIGRYAEMNGKKSIDNDIITHAFEIPSRSRDDFDKAALSSRKLAHAYAAGYNWFLAKHPEVKPRLLTHADPWHLLAFSRRAWLEITCTSNGISRSFFPGRENEVYEQIGSNAWAIAPSRTKDKNAMLFINPHQPFYGYGQWYESHVHTADGIDFYGASFFGSPLPSIGHNHTCGWTFTVNVPDVADVWHVRFDDPNRPNHYRHGDTYREATVWTEVIKIKGEPDRKYTFRKTHHGPILRNEKEDPTVFHAVAISKLYENDFAGQTEKMVRSKDVHEFRQAMSGLNYPIFNAVAADSKGNIFYMFNGPVPKRDESFDFTKHLDGNDPRTDWKGLHSIDDLPQILNPESGYVQSCNASPFTTTDDGNPFKDDFPKYMVVDKDSDKRRSKVSRHILRQQKDLTIDGLEKLAFDTLMYWPMNELPVLRRLHEELKERNSELAAKSEEYLRHFDGWDCRVALDCTRSPLCVQWYEELYGFGYPAETLRGEYKDNPDKKFEALINAAKKLTDNFGTWKPKWGDVYRLQRHHNVSDLLTIPLSDKKPSIPCVGAPGPLGIVFTVYYSPSVYVPFVREMRKHYAVVGTSYTGVVEFKKDGVDSRSLIQFGAKSDPNSPHYDDQMKLMSESKMKKTEFNWDEIKKTAKAYQPGEEKG
jgi:penicillin amidase